MPLRVGFACLVLLSMLLSCGTPSSMGQNELSPASSAVTTSALVIETTALPNTDPQHPVYRFGVTPWQKDLTEDKVRALYKPLLSALGAQVDAEFVIVGAKDYAQISTMLAQGHVQFATISPAPFVAAQRDNPNVKMLVTELSWNLDKTKRSDSYTGYIVTLKSRSDINTVADLQGKKVGFVSKESTSGFVVPRFVLQEQGIDYQTFFGHTYFIGSHPLVTDALVAGSIDAGATWDYNLSQAIALHGDVFKPILTSPPIPNLGIAVHSDVPAAVQEAVKRALLNADPVLLSGLSTAGYIERSDSFYDVIRKMEAAN